MPSELTTERPIYKLSCFGLRNSYNIISGTDLSPEEARWQYKQDPNGYLNAIGNLVNNVENEIARVKRNPAEAVQLAAANQQGSAIASTTFGGNSTVSAFGGNSAISAFGGNTTVSAFGPPTTTSAFARTGFGSTATSSFESSKPGSAFGQTGFGTTTAASAFGQPTAFATPPTSAFSTPPGTYN